MNFLYSRKDILAGAAATLGAGFASAVNAGSAQAATTTPSVNVRDHGAKGDGATDDTAAFRAALVAANGSETYVPPGHYILGTLIIDSVARLRLDPAARLVHKPGAGNGYMFVFRGQELRITGGTIDGNKSNQPGRPYVVTGAVDSGKYLHFEDVAIVNTVASFVYAQNFGGVIVMERCRISGQAEHDGIAGHTTSILRVISGQGGTHGLVRFNHNICIGTDSPGVAGGSPGGVFLATNGYVDGAPGTDGFAQGNMSTLEAIGNYFWGYGQNAAGNDISPLHTYPTLNGARIIGNYFERCGFCAISAKSVTNFICANNVVVNGMTSSQNIASEGAISYMPGYQAGTFARPRAIISGNVVDTPGGQPEERQAGISVHGLAYSHAQQVVIAENVLSGCGRGIKVNYVDDLTVTNNVIDGSRGDATHTRDEDGIRMDNVFGTVLVNGNRIATPHGNGLYALAGVATARFSIMDNIFEHSSALHYGTTLRGCAFVRMEGNTFRATAGTAVYLTASGATKIGHLHMGDNSFVQGAAIFDFPNIGKATGRLQYSVDPRGRVTPGEVGTTYRRTAGKEPDSLWVATGLSPADWAPVLTAGVDGRVPTVKLAGGAGTGATASVLGNDSEGVVQVNTGSSPTAGGVVATLVFASVRPAAPKAVVITAANAAAAAQISNVYAPRSGMTASTFALTNGATALRPSTTFEWHYRVL